MFNKYLRILISVIFISLLSQPALCQVASINKFVGHVESRVNQANQLMDGGNVKKAVETLNDANRYIESVVNFDLEEQFIKARMENPGFTFDLPDRLAGGFDASYWQRKYDLALSSLNNSKSAISGVSSLKTLDRQDEAWAYIKTVYDSVKTVKDVIENVGSQDYYDAVKSAKEGIDGFIENYKQIEQTYLQKLETELFQMEINGLIRRANRAIRKTEPVLSYMKANAEEGQRYRQLLARAQKIKDKVLAGAVQKLEFGDARYTWNYGQFQKQVESACREYREYEVKPSELKKEYLQIKADARKSWEKVRGNIIASNDQAQKDRFLGYAAAAWNDFESVVEKEYNSALKSVSGSEAKKDQKAGKPNVFAGTDVTESEKQKPAKLNLFAGTDKKEPPSEKTTESRPNPFAGTGVKESSRPSDKPETPTRNTPDKGKSNSRKPDAQNAGGILLGTITNDGKGNNKNQKGGTYLGVDIKKTDDEDIISIEVFSGALKFVHIHLRNSQGVWYSIYNGRNTLFRVGDLLKNVRSAYTHLNFSVNGQHVRYLPVACAANVILYKKGSIPADIQSNLVAQWHRGTGEVPNDYLKKRPGLWLKGKGPTISAQARKKPEDKSSARVARTKKKTDQPRPDKKDALQSDSKKRDDELRALVTKMNGVIQKADADFNKKYWEDNSRPKTTQKATNAKASTLKIMMQAVRIAESAKFPENRITLNYMAARKLIEYSGRVFGYVGKREFFVQAASCLHKAGGLIRKVKTDKVSQSFMFTKQGEMWRLLGSKALVGGHSYNKNECYKLEVSAHQQALNLYPENHKSKRYLNK